MPVVARRPRHTIDEKHVSCTVRPYYEIYSEPDGNMYSDKHVRIMPQVDDFRAYNLSSDILSRGKLPRAEDGGVPTLESTPFEMNGHYFVITDCNRYLKRLAEDA
eukprot:COSAG01_NODE_2448_length_7682_cov_10.409600_12_plen_105_part_00